MFTGILLIDKTITSIENKAYSDNTFFCGISLSNELAPH